MQRGKKKKKKQREREREREASMGRGEDRISSLPDEILQNILCLMPLKYAIRTSTLSRRWVHLWQFNLITSTALQFGADFSCNQSPKQFVATLDRYLQIHGDGNLDKFGILFSPFNRFFPDLENWVRVVLAKGVQELDVDLSQGVVNSCTGHYIDDRTPFEISSALFDRNSLTCLCLSRCNLAYDFDMTKFAGLNSLSLDHVFLTEQMVSNILESCVSLESMSLKRCYELEMVKFVGDTLKLRKLTMVDCRGVYDLEISLPKLESFLYHGSLSLTHAFGNVSRVTDAYLCSVGLDDTDEEIVVVLSAFSHVRVLTMCSFILISVVLEEEYNEDQFPVELRNLQEFQLILDSISEEHLCCIFSFFRLCPAPFLEKLFIQLPSNLDRHGDLSDWVAADKDTPDVAFQNLKWIKISNFEGSQIELKLVKFLLERTVVLESIFLVTKQCEESNNSLPMRILQGQLSVLPKASKDARIVLCQSSDRDCAMKPTHTSNYYREEYRNGTTVHLDDGTIVDVEIVLDQEFL